jgi:hypothetical protein
VAVEGVRGCGQRVDSFRVCKKPSDGRERVGQEERLLPHRIACYSLREGLWQTSWALEQRRKSAV